MENSIFIGLSRQVVLRTHMDLVSNNLANMNTPGFRGQNLVFEEYLAAPRGGDRPVSMVDRYGQYQVTREGAVKETGNPLNIALNGPGFIGIQTAGGIRYTRAGQFELNADGALVTHTGHPVADSGGGTIVIPPEARDISIAEDGFVSTDQGQIAQIMVVEFDNVQELSPEGDGFYVTDAPANPAENTRVRQGMIEGSNIQPVLEVTRMIEIHREYQKIQQMLQSEHERQRTMLQRLSRNS